MSKATIKQDVLSAREQALKLPAPTVGLRFEALPLDVICEYISIHNLAVERQANGTVVVRLPKNNSMIEVASNLAKA